MKYWKDCFSDLKKKRSRKVAFVINFYNHLILLFFCACLHFLPSLSYSSWLTGWKKPKQVTYFVLWHLHINLWRCIGSGYVMLWWFRLVIITHNQTDVWCVNVCVGVYNHKKYWWKVEFGAWFVLKWLNASCLNGSGFWGSCCANLVDN